MTGDRSTAPLCNRTVGATHLLELEKIRQLVEMMVANDLVELALRDGDVEVKLRRPNPVGSEVAVVTQAAPPVAPTAGTGATSDVFVPGEVVDVEYVEIRSPMVGTFYASPDPDSAPFVQVGSSVGPSTVVCVLEAMKVFSEIKAETSGAIDRVLVKDGEAVEYGQPLFLVRPH